MKKQKLEDPNLPNNINPEGVNSIVNPVTVIGPAVPIVQSTQNIVKE